MLIRVDLYDQVVKYVLVKKSDKWFIEQYERHSYSNEESGEIRRNS